LLKVIGGIYCFLSCNGYAFEGGEIMPEQQGSSQEAVEVASRESGHKERVTGKWNSRFNRAADKLRPLTELHRSRERNYLFALSDNAFGIVRSLVTQPVWGVAELGARLTGGRIQKVEAATTKK
jgi:hypothetical protein